MIFYDDGSNYHNGELLNSSQGDDQQHNCWKSDVVVEATIAAMGHTLNDMENLHLHYTQGKRMKTTKKWTYRHSSWEKCLPVSGRQGKVSAPQKYKDTIWVASKTFSQRFYLQVNKRIPIRWWQVFEITHLGFLIQTIFLIKQPTGAIVNGGTSLVEHLPRPAPPRSIRVDVKRSDKMSKSSHSLYWQHMPPYPMLPVDSR